MPNINPNSTNYTHSSEPNTNDLVQAMAYDPEGKPVVRIDDTSLQHTSSDRAKVSDFEVVFFNTFQFDKESDVWDESTTTGGSAAHDANAREVVMTVDGTQAGAKVIRQTFSVQRYVPGRQLQTSYACVFGAGAAGIRRRVGQFDERNGFFLEQIGDELAFVVRSDASGSVVETRTLQADWNQDRLDGTDTTGITLDMTKRQIVYFEMEWYGAGLCELKFIIDDHARSCHKYFHGNRQELPWMGTPFVPARFEIENVSATSGTYTLKQGSSSNILEGRTGKQGISASVSSPITGTTLDAANTWYPVLSIRLQSGRLNGVVLPRYFQVATIDNTNMFYRLVRNATLPADVVAGQDGPQPYLVVPDSGSTFTEYQTYINPAAVAEGDQGSRLDTGFVIAGGGGAQIKLDNDVQFQLGRSSLGTVSDEFTLLVASTGANKDAIASITWIEQR